MVLGCNGPSWQVHRQRQNIISSCVADTQDTLSSALRKSIRTKLTFNYGQFACINIQVAWEVKIVEINELNVKKCKKILITRLNSSRF